MFDPPITPEPEPLAPWPPEEGQRLLTPYEQAERDLDHAAFIAALIPALIIIAASIAMIFALQP